MESQKPKVAMYVKRSFGDKLNASFDFIKENWKILLKFTTYLLLPVSLIQALSLNGLMERLPRLLCPRLRRCRILHLYWDLCPITVCI